MADLKNNQVFSNHGGPREGAGWPRGSRDPEVSELIEWLRGFFRSKEGRSVLEGRLRSSDKVLLALVDRAYGRVRDVADITVHRSLDDLSDDELLTIVKAGLDAPKVP